MKITKIYFPQITAIKLEGEGMEPKYFSQTPGDQTFPIEDAIADEEDWRRALREAREKGAKVEVNEV